MDSSWHDKLRKFWARDTRLTDKTLAVLRLTDLEDVDLSGLDIPRGSVASCRRLTRIRKLNILGRSTDAGLDSWPA